MKPRRKVGNFPLWVAHMELPPGEKRGGVWHQPIKVVLHRRRAMLWALLTGRVRFTRGGAA